MSKICTIICGAPCEKFSSEICGGFVIAADKGLDYALKAGITPNLVVGDFDSAENSVPNGVEVLRFPPEKDETDAFIAAKAALERGFDELNFLCALGGRLDHTLANIQMLYFLKTRGVKARLFGYRESAFVLQNESVKIPRFSGYLSVFAYEKSAVVTELGVKYPAQRLVFTNSFPLGVSNEIVEDCAEIIVHKGAALIVTHKN